MGVLEELAKEEWASIELVAPGIKRVGLRAVANELRILGQRVVSIGAVSVRLGKANEVFTIQADTGGSSPAWADKVWAPQIEDAGELASAFLGRAHQLLVGARLHRFPSGGGHSDREVLVEDLLVLRDLSGQQAFITPDDEHPGMIVLARQYEDVPFSDLPIEYLRMLA